MFLLLKIPMWTTSKSLCAKSAARLRDVDQTFGITLRIVILPATFSTPATSVAKIFNPSAPSKTTEPEYTCKCTLIRLILSFLSFWICWSFRTLPRSLRANEVCCEQSQSCGQGHLHVPNMRQVVQPCGPRARPRGECPFSKQFPVHLWGLRPSSEIKDCP